MFDLAEVRIRLDQMTERILSRLKDRSRFPQNPAVYRAGGVPIEGRTGISFLDFSLEGLERYHGSLGRYAFPDQYPLFSGQVYESPVVRTIASSETPKILIELKDDLLVFYQDVVAMLCTAGDDVSTYGETVYIDADLLTLLHERINIGRHIAAAKYSSNPGLRDILGDSPALSDALRDVVREQALLTSVEASANRYDLDPKVARSVFEWIVARTLALEVSYLQGLEAENSLETLLA